MICTHPRRLGFVACSQLGKVVVCAVKAYEDSYSSRTCFLGVSLLFEKGRAVGQRSKQGLTRPAMQRQHQLCPELLRTEADCEWLCAVQSSQCARSLGDRVSGAPAGSWAGDEERDGQRRRSGLRSDRTS